MQLIAVDLEDLLVWEDLRVLEVLLVMGLEQLMVLEDFWILEDLHLFLLASKVHQYPLAQRSMKNSAVLSMNNSAVQ